MPRQNTIQLRKGTLSQWTANNTQILASGEPGFEVDTLRLKIGDGTTAWSGLNYVGLAGTGTSGYLPKFNSSQGVSNSLIYDDGTNVGIGIDSPTQKLHVSGNALVSSGLYIGFQPLSNVPGLYLRPTDSSSLAWCFLIQNSSYSNLFEIRNDGNGQIGDFTGLALSHRFNIKGSTSTNSSVGALNVVNSGNSPLFFVHNSGNVGIGTAAPSARLEVVASGTTNLDVAHFSNSNGVEKAKVSISSAGDGTLSLIDASNNTDIFFTSNTSTASYINAGNVGIGLTNPAEKLEIDGSLKFANCASRILRGDNNNIRLSSGGSALGHFGILIDNTGTTNGRIFRVASWADGTTGKFIIRDDTAGADRLVIQANGTIGIGTDTPTERLHVSGAQTTIRLNNSLSYDTQLRLTDIASDWSVGVNQGNSLGSGVFSIRSITAASSRLVIDTNGNVGIGTTAPSAKLHSEITDGNSVLLLQRSSSQGGLSVDFTGASSNLRSLNGFKIFTGSVAANAGTERLHITSGGDVGIGTASPGYKLQVAGSFGATTKSFRIDHPSKSGWNLEYGSLESPYHGVRLTGRGTVVKGVGVVVLPDYLKDLIHDDDTLNIQITNIKHGKTIYLEKIDLKNDQFIVKVDRAKSLGELQFCWTLSGVRKDVDHLVVEKEN